MTCMPTEEQSPSFRYLLEVNCTLNGWVKLTVWGLMLQAVQEVTVVSRGVGAAKHRDISHIN